MDYVIRNYSSCQRGGSKKCMRCMTVMEAGTTYERKKNGEPSARRYYECKKCHDKVYTKEPNFQECMYKASRKM